MTFQDHFSAKSKEYARFRPHYPPQLLGYLSQLAEDHQKAWDCATGNGQVAVDLTPYFEQIYASDGSQKQIDHAIVHERVHYFVSPAELTSLDEHSIDLITVAQAVHWFDLPRFFTEAKRVLKPKGILAIWCYGWFEIPDAPPAFQVSLKNFLAAIAPFWPPERSLIEDRYQSIEFPFRELDTPLFTMTVEWSIDQVLGYLQTWSATQYFVKNQGEAVLNTYLESMFQAWENSEISRSVQWPIALRIGKK
jgi:ubiquinone/menaquinone biosynthesis C-methylase UbiE